MPKSFARGMAKAAELTRTGKLQDATDLIQSLLGNPADAGGQNIADGAIDGTFTRLDPALPGPFMSAKPLRPPKPADARRGGRDRGGGLS